MTIAINRSSVTALASHLSGTNVNSSNSPENFGDPAVQAFVRPLEPAVLRWPGGTVSDFFDWNTGLIPPAGAAHPSPIDIESAVFRPFPSIAFNLQFPKMTGYLQPILAGKGGNPLGDTKSGFGGLATALGAKFVVVVNATTDTVQSAQQLAFTIAQRKLPVVEFELVNEPYFVVIPTSAGTFKLPPGAPNVPGAYTSGIDYLTKMKPYYNAIKQGYSAAGANPSAAVVAIGGGYAADNAAWNLQWMQDLSTYTYNNGAYWDAVAIHFYPAQQNVGSFSQAMTYANDGLATGTAAFIQAYRAANWSRGKPLFLSEFNVTMSDTTMNGSLYAGIFTAEYVARMSVFPETASLMLHELFNDQNGIGVPATAIDGTLDWQSTLIAAGQAGKTINTTGRIKGMFYNAQILGLGLVDAAVNASDETYATNLSGALGSVPTLTATLPAVYAQAYHGRDGTTHVIITNKGADAKLASLTLDGQTVATTVSADSIRPTAGDPSQMNSGTAQPIAVLHASAKGPVTVPGYSVMHLHFTAS